MSTVQPVPIGFGSQPPFTHVYPIGQVPHTASHCPSMQIFPVPQSLLYLHAFVLAVHTPPTHDCPFAQSPLTLHGHGPPWPPHASHLPPKQPSPGGQSEFFMHWGAESPALSADPSLWLLPSPVVTSGAV
jgi:hypothetical protein